ncbi:S-adenosyl-L-methionine-dependent methyltransferase [Ramicandelaber brevisporus]|nr:S-adenosyl-L-methionine-dependent methyltransferase [Ramicandelaber brevisporus]
MCLEKLFSSHLRDTLRTWRSNSLGLLRISMRWPSLQTNKLSLAGESVPLKAGRYLVRKHRGHGTASPDHRHKPPGRIHSQRHHHQSKLYELKPIYSSTASRPKRLRADGCGVSPVPTVVFRAEGSCTSIPSQIAKYWHQRYTLFSRYDEGIRLDEESWYSVTPEPIAEHIARRISSKEYEFLVVDAFCGAGGNAIQFALAGFYVIAIDIDPQKIEIARHNASIYGVSEYIEFINGDSTQIAKSLKADAVFLSPPWGGPEYLNQDVFPMSAMLPLHGVELFELYKNISNNLVYFLPRNSDMNEVALMAGPGGRCELEQNIMYGKAKSLCAYFNALIIDDPPQQ